MRAIVGLLAVVTLINCGASQDPGTDAALPMDAAVAIATDAALAGPDASAPRGDEGQSCLEDGKCHGALECVSATCRAAIPTPQGLAATGSDYAIALSWKWIGDASVQFQILRRRVGESDFAPLSTVSFPTTTVTDSAIELGVSFEYALVAQVGERLSLPCAPVVAQAKIEPKEWTLLYFVASDGDYGYTYWFNIEGLEGQGGSTAKVNVVALYDGFDKGDSQYLFVGDSPAHTTSTRPPRAPDGEVNMGDFKSYADFIDWMLPRYSARHYLISFHDHGGGAVEPKRARNMLYDQTSGDSLDPDEQAHVVAYLSQKIGRKVDVVESMTCLGQMAENTWGMRDSAQFHIGAESLSYVTGSYPLSYLAANPAAPAKDVALALVKDHAQGIVDMDAPCTWSLIDLSHLQALGDKLTTIASGLEAFAVTEVQKRLLRDVVGQAQNFSYQSPDLMGAYVDLRDLAARIGAEASLPLPVRAAAGDIVTLFDTGGLVAFNSQHSGTHPQTTLVADYSRASGLSIYHPNKAWPYYTYSATPPYESLSFAVATGWADYLQSVSLPVPTGKCTKVADLKAEKQADGSVKIAWTHAANDQGCDAFYCSRDLGGKFTGVYQTIARSGDAATFTADDAPTDPGSYTWRVTAFRASDAASLNWSTSAAVTLP